MVERFIKKTTKTDFVGTYVEYEYADGHLETSPAGRPKSREDVQRERLQVAAGLKAQRQLEGQRSKLSAYGTSTPANIVRENLVAIAGRDLTAPFQNTMHALETIADTVRGPDGLGQALVENYDLGGVITGDHSGDRGEYGFPTPDRVEDNRAGTKERRYPGRLR